MKIFKNSKTNKGRANGQAGFTLIELLVVIAIIGILASVVLASLSSARAKSRDAKRAADVKQLKVALEMYYNDNGSYPPSGADDSGSYMNVLATPLLPYIKVIPDDPLGASHAWQYVRGSVSSTNYGLYVYTEKSNAYCGSGVNFNAGWWGIGANMCPF